MWSVNADSAQYGRLPSVKGLAKKNPVRVYGVRSLGALLERTLTSSGRIGTGLRDAGWLQKRLFARLAVSLAV
jgi:hypothetical protein